MNRHNERHKAWQPDESTRKAFRDLPGGWYVFVAELLHSKVPSIRNTNYINDILVADSESLVGTTFAERQKMLSELFPGAVPSMARSHSVIDSNTWLARNYKGGFQTLFDSLTAAEDEGLVLKDPQATLNYCSRATANSGWQVKCQKPTKVLSF